MVWVLNWHTISSTLLWPKQNTQPAHIQGRYSSSLFVYNKQPQKLSSIKQQSFMLLINLPFGQASVGTLHLYSTRSQLHSLTRAAGSSSDDVQLYGWQFPLPLTLSWGRLVSFQHDGWIPGSKHLKRQEVAAGNFLRFGPEIVTALLLPYPFC